MKWHDDLRALGACYGAVEWAKQHKTFTAAWNECERGDWMLWLSARVGVDHKMIVLAACACARTVLKHVPKGEGRPLAAIETAEAWVRGEATIKQTRSASDSAAAAAYAAAYACAAASAAAASAAASACASAYASAAAAYSAASACAAASAAAASAAQTKSFKKSASLVRKHISARQVQAAWRQK